MMRNRTNGARRTGPGFDNLMKTTAGKGRRLPLN
jgi:hypothetical protein